MSEIQFNLASDARGEQFDPHAYTIVVKRVTLDGEPVFHGKVLEFPDLESFEASYEDAYSFLIDGIRTAKSAFDEQGRIFPAPLPDETADYSGRVTIRMPSWLHAQLDYLANADQTSLNQYMVTLLSWAVVAAPKWIPQNQVIGSTRHWHSAIPGSFAIGQVAGGSVASTYAGALHGAIQDLLSVQFNILGATSPGVPPVYVMGGMEPDEWRSSVSAKPAQKAPKVRAIAGTARRMVR